jgi:hypothetical protein
MEPLGINGNPNAARIILEEFIDGRKPESNRTLQQSQEDENFLKNIMKKISENYAWNDKSSFSLMAGQNCSDMLVNIGE